MGRLRPALREVCDDYARRLRRYGRLQEIEVREAGRAPSAEVGRAREAAALLERLPRGARLVALTRSGTAWSSAEVARRLDRWRSAGGPLAFAVGGSHGLGPEVLQRAEALWSFGPLTLPHELARVVLLEQLYRAFAILEGRPYHKGR